eukprot:scaffold163840_cov19-Tisochrysis_lutea.AAC.1
MKITTVEQSLWKFHGGWCKLWQAAGAMLERRSRSPSLLGVASVWVALMTFSLGNMQFTCSQGKHISANTQ